MCAPLAINIVVLVPTSCQWHGSPYRRSPCRCISPICPKCLSGVIGRRDHCSGCKPATSLQVDSSFLPLLSSPNFKTDRFTRAEVFYAPLPSPSNQPKCENAKLASGLVRPSVCSVCMRSGGGNDVILVVIKIIRVAGEIESYGIARLVS